VVAVRLTSDHNCSSESERDRIRRSGGFVYRGRVAGVLAVTRSLGDQALKRYVLAQPHICTATTRTPASRGHQSLSGSAEPEDFTNKENRGASAPAAAAADCGAAASPSSPGPGSLGDFLIVACDGLWDVVDDQSAADFVAEQLRRGADPSRVAPMLVGEALRRGTGDNVSVIVAFL
jgi:serine/threonine protein phosphatase PrpC